MSFPSFFQVTFTLGVPANVTSRRRGLPFSEEMSLSFFTKWTGSERGNVFIN